MVEFAEDVVQEQDGLGADDLGDDAVRGEAQTEREGALLALRRVGSALAASDR